MESPLPSPLGLASAQFVAAWKAHGLPRGRDGALERYTALFRDGVLDGPVLPVSVPPVVRTHTSESHEGTVLKFCQRVHDGGTGRDHLETESVLIPMIGKKRVRSYTLCVSSQVGCAMGCGFCQTAQMGLLRSLSADEIVAQWFAARFLVQRPDPDAVIANIVFMGMGEPLDNFDAVVQAIAVLSDHRGPSIAMRKITVSTVGRVDGLERLAHRVHRPGWHRLGLALSLNAPTDEIRGALMPVNRAWPLARLRQALLAWPLYGGAHQCLEYVLIPGVNDAPHHAQQLGAFVRGEAYVPPAGTAADAVTRYAGPPLQALVNVIPYNPRDHSPWPAPTEESVDRFMTDLSSTGTYVKRRRTKGRDTMAACGQLGNPAVRRARTHAVTVSR